MKTKIWIFLLLITASMEGAIAKRTFAFSLEPIDVVIPCAPKDQRSLERSIQGIRENGQNIRRIIVVSKDKLTDAAEWFSEEAFPFSKKTLAAEIFREGGAQEFLEHPETRIGWLLQQFLKLYAPLVIPDISSNVLVLDADVIFLNPVDFMSESGSPYFTPSYEPPHAPYFNHGERLLEGWHRVFPGYSGIAHHMLFQRPILEDLFAMIQQQHGVEPWKAICRCIDRNEVGFSGMSEYEIYFNYVLLRTDQAKIRPLQWTLIHSLFLTAGFKRQGYAYVCYPTWLAPSLR